MCESRAQLLVTWALGSEDYDFHCCLGGHVCAEETKQWENPKCTDEEKKIKTSEINFIIV